jgi:hypothetical protein
MPSNGSQQSPTKEGSETVGADDDGLRGHSFRFSNGKFSSLKEKLLRLKSAFGRLLSAPNSLFHSHDSYSTGVKPPKRFPLSQISARVAVAAAAPQQAKVHAEFSEDQGSEADRGQWH